MIAVNFLTSQGHYHTLIDPTVSTLFFSLREVQETLFFSFYFQIEEKNPRDLRWLFLYFVYLLSVFPILFTWCLFPF